MSHMDEVARSYREDINAAFDCGIGFVRAGIADDIENRFGVFPNFGIAGGCVNILFVLESGHAVYVTDAEDCMLTHAAIRTAEDGFHVAVYRNRDAVGMGDAPLVTMSRHVAADGLCDLIEDCLKQLR